MMKQILNNLIKWLQKFQEEDINLESISSHREDLDISVPVNRIIKDFDYSKKNIIIIDDSRGIVSVVEDFVREVEKKGTIDLDDYNVLTFYDKYAPFVLQETLERLEPIKVEFAIVDIVLPGKLKVDDAYVRLDGVDVAVLLNEKYDCNNLCFFTGNVVSEHIGYIKDKIIKFKNFFGTDIQDYIIFKGDNDFSITINRLDDLFSKKDFNLTVKK